MRRLVFALLALVLSLPGLAQTCGKGLHAYAGTYVPSTWSIEGYTKVDVREGVLTWGPPLWKPARILQQVGDDTFEMKERPERKFHFSRDAGGCVISLEGFGFEGPLRRTRPGEIPAFQKLLYGNDAQAIAALRSFAGVGPERLVELAGRMLSVPSAIPSAVRLATQLTKMYPRDARVWTVLGDAQVASGKQQIAKASYKRAVELDASNKEARRDLSMMQHRASVSGLPFPLNAVFQAPSPKEVQEVRRQWREFDPSPTNVVTVLQDSLEVNGTRFHLRILSVALNSEQQYGVVLVPENAKGKLPVLVEAKGVSPSFFPLSIPDGVNLSEILGKELGDFIIILPGYRGEEVRYRDKAWKSESDHESWSGAADDLLAFLNVVLSTTPQADSSRIGVFGRSRGGTVALLAAERDPRIRCVVAWAAPTDWFSLMGHDGWTLEQSVGDAIRNHAKLEEREGQYVYNFLRYALAGKEGLADVRRRILASSPLYFANSLPPTQVHYGIEDSIVPARNGHALVRRNAHIDAHFHPDAGHDQDLFLAPRQAKAFLLRNLDSGRSRN